MVILISILFSTKSIFRKSFCHVGEQQTTCNSFSLYHAKSLNSILLSKFLAPGTASPRACQYKAARPPASAGRAFVGAPRSRPCSTSTCTRLVPSRDPDIKVQDIFARSQFRIERDGRRIAEVIGTAMRDITLGSVSDDGTKVFNRAISPDQLEVHDSSFLLVCCPGNNMIRVALKTVRRQGATRARCRCASQLRSNAGVGLFSAQPFGPQSFGCRPALLARPVSEPIQALRSRLGRRPTPSGAHHAISGTAH